MAQVRLLTDACGRQLWAPLAPRRVISLCPSLTETLLALGLGEALVGRTRYCIHPRDELQDVATVGGTKQLDQTAIAGLAPDLIIAEQEENRREDVDVLATRWPVFVCRIRSLADAHRAIAQLADLIGRPLQGERLEQAIAAAWSELPSPAHPLPVVYLIWRKPWMAAGRDTYIDAVLSRLGLHNLAADLPGRYPQLRPEDLAEMAPQLCLLSSEPYPFKATHGRELSAWWPQARMQQVDGEMFSWYGSRMLPAAAYLRDLLARWQA